MVQVLIEISEDIASKFSEQPGGVDRAALESLALEGVRSGRITVHQARLMLGIATRYEMDGFLKSHAVFLPDTIESVIKESEAFTHFLRR